MNSQIETLPTTNHEPRSAHTGRLRVALVGCGAIAEQMHLPVLAGHEGLTLAALVDRDQERARRLADGYGVKSVLADVDEISPADFDAVIVATPPFHHAPAAIGLMRRGLHVLVEKPMAINYTDAAAMVDTAEQTGVILSVGLYRRLYPSLQLLKGLLDAEYFGRPLHIDLEGGSVYGWSAATLGSMKKDLAGGGVLMDMGPHYFDQLLYLFPGTAQVVRYEDNSLGGIESECSIDLQLHHGTAAVEAHIELSRARSLRNTLIVHCERGVFELGFSERDQVSMRPHGLNVHDPVSGRQRDCSLVATWSDYADKPWYETFRAEIDDWLRAIATSTEPQLSGRSALPSMKLIDDCYQNRQFKNERWGEYPRSSAVKASSSAVKRQVLITGATGFIGSRVAEVLSGREDIFVRALVHNPANASRLARLPVEMIQGDLCDEATLATALRGCDSVIHCAVGTAYGDDRAILKVTVGGTQALVRAAEKCGGMRRFVHLSSIAVYGDSPAQTIDENTPVGPNKGDAYGHSKLLAEQAVQGATGRGLSAFILRPACVYGPFGATFISRPLANLKDGRLVLHNSAGAPSNTVYVDNLVAAIIRCIEADECAQGNVFNVVDDDATTWGDFYGYFAAAAGLPLRIVNQGNGTGAAQNGSAVKKRRGMIASVGELFTSPEFKEFGKRALATDPIGTVPRFLIDRVPAIDTRLRRLMGSDRPSVYERPSADLGNDFPWTTARRAIVSGRRIVEALNYQPSYARNEAMARTFEWAKHSRIL